MFCPLRNAWKLVCKEECMHRGGSVEECRFKDNAKVADLQEKARLQAITEMHSVDKHKVLAAAQRIKLVIVADAFVEYVTGRSILDQKGGELNLDQSSFDTWNKTAFTFDEVTSIIQEVNLAIRRKHNEVTQPT